MNKNESEGHGKEFKGKAKEAIVEDEEMDDGDAGSESDEEEQSVLLYKDASGDEGGQVAEEEDDEEEDDGDGDGITAPDRSGRIGTFGDVQGCEPCALYCECELESTGSDLCSIGEEGSDACLSGGDGSLWLECMDSQSRLSCEDMLDGRTCGEPLFR